MGESFNGTVERFPISGASDVQDLLEARIAEGGVGGILTLNHGFVDSAAAARGEHELEVSTFGFAAPPLIARIVQGDILFLIFDHPQAQGYLTGAAMAVTGFLGQFGNAGC